MTNNRTGQLKAGQPFPILAHQPEQRNIHEFAIMEHRLTKCPFVLEAALFGQFFTGLVFRENSQQKPVDWPDFKHIGNKQIKRLTHIAFATVFRSQNPVSDFVTVDEHKTLKKGDGPDKFIGFVYNMKFTGILSPEIVFTKTLQLL